MESEAQGKIRYFNQREGMSAASNANILSFTAAWLRQDSATEISEPCHNSGPGPALMPLH